MLEGKCPNSDCGKNYYGWALLESKHQNCDICGRKLIVADKKESIPMIIC